MSRNTISAQLLGKSKSTQGDYTIATFLLEYPRWIHAELLTHRVFSRNSASSRAIPVNNSLNLVQDHPAYPSHWGLNQRGMQDTGNSLHGWKRVLADAAWYSSMTHSTRSAWMLNKLGVHKQYVNRILEPFSHIRVVVTSTEWSNFLALRYHPDAHPDICFLARLISEALDSVLPQILAPGEWHLPFFGPGYWTPETSSGTSLDNARMISASCCAQVSYRKQDTSIDKACAIYDRLINAEPMHASPFEHQATPIRAPVVRSLKRLSEPGITGINRDKMLTSGNFTGWCQWRQILMNERNASCNTK